MDNGARFRLNTKPSSWCCWFKFLMNLKLFSFRFNWPSKHKFKRGFCQPQTVNQPWVLNGKIFCSFLKLDSWMSFQIQFSKESPNNFHCKTAKMWALRWNIITHTTAYVNGSRNRQHKHRSQHRKRNGKGKKILLLHLELRNLLSWSRFFMKKNVKSFTHQHNRRRCGAAAAKEVKEKHEC